MAGLWLCIGFISGVLIMCAVVSARIGDELNGMVFDDDDDIPGQEAKHVQEEDGES